MGSRRGRGSPGSVRGLVEGRVKREGGGRGYLADRTGDFEFGAGLRCVTGEIVIRLLSTSHTLLKLNISSVIRRINRVLEASGIV